MIKDRENATKNEEGYYSFSAVEDQFRRDKPDHQVMEPKYKPRPKLTAQKRRKKQDAKAARRR